MWNAIVVWCKSKGGWAHVVAVVFVTAVGAYAGVPAFKQLVDGVYGTTPSWAHQVILAALGLYAWYKRTSSPAGALQHVSEDQAAGAAPEA